MPRMGRRQIYEFDRAMSIAGNLLFTPLRVIARQRWIRRGIRERILRLFAHPERLPSYQFESNFFGLRYRGNLRNLLDWNVFFYGAYEREFLLLMEDLLKYSHLPVCADIGANIGHHTLFMSRISTTVFAFEPLMSARSILESRLEANHITNVKVYDFGLGSDNEAKYYYAPRGSNQGTGSFVREHSSANDPTPLSLRLVKGDDFFEGASIEKLDLIKIDVEGFEKAVLLGLERTLVRHRPIVLMEYSETTQRFIRSMSELRALFPAGYQFYGIESRRVYLWFFEYGRYILEDLNSNVPPNEILAVPGFHSVAHLSPTSRPKLPWDGRQ
jgi:FkbM family methyltransferase